MRAQTALAQAGTISDQGRSFVWHVESASSKNREAPQRLPGVASGAKADGLAPEPASGPIRFLKGKVVAVDCSAVPHAVLNLIAGSTSITLHVRDSQHVVVVGADEFSCGWKNKSLAVNYRERADGDGDVISVEVQ